MPVPNPDTLAQIASSIPGAHYVSTEGADGELGTGLWVPYGQGFEIPVLFSYEGSGPFRWQMWIGVMEDGRPQCVQLQCDGVVTAEALRKLPLGRLVEEATLIASRPADQVPRKYQMWRDVEHARSERAAVLQQHRRGPKRPKVLTDEFLREVAEVYRKNIPAGKPSRAVAQHFNYEPSSARRVVREARLRGLLGPALPGRGGEGQPKEGNDG